MFLGEDEVSGINFLNMLVKSEEPPAVCLLIGYKSSFFSICLKISSYLVILKCTLFPVFSMCNSCNILLLSSTYKSPISFFKNGNSCSTNSKSFL